MKKLFLILSLMIVSVLFAACGDLASSVGPKKSVNPLTEPGALTAIMQELQNRENLKGHELQVFQGFSINYDEKYGTSISIEILKPGTTEDVDNYTYRDGSWSGPSPVKITGDGDMSDNLTPFASFPFDKIPALRAELESKTKDLEGVKPVDFLLFSFTHDGDIRIYMSAKSDRAEYSAKWDINGTLLDFHKK